MVIRQGGVSGSYVQPFRNNRKCYGLEWHLPTQLTIYSNIFKSTNYIPIVRPSSEDLKTQPTLQVTLQHTYIRCGKLQIVVTPVVLRKNLFISYCHFHHYDNFSSAVHCKRQNKAIWPINRLRKSTANLTINM
jgi:hypothetical protein